MYKLLKNFPFIKNISNKLDNQNERDIFVRLELGKLAPKLKILDAGCGSQRYKIMCSHLNYFSQDFGKYKVDDKKMLGTLGMGGSDGYKYGELDYIGDIWNIGEDGDFFDAILCTEVFEHIPYPNETIAEFSRILKRNGKLILTAPSNCLRHMDPYFFYSGFSDRWFEYILSKNGFTIIKIKPVGDYYSWMSVELARTAMSHSILSKIILFPAFIYFYLKKKTQVSTDTLCMGYHIVAIKS
jgi:SAM-dependent methyltransferase